jgi:hypothetical protein
MERSEYLKCVLWPRVPLKEEGKATNYRYVIVGMLITDQPLQLPEVSRVTEVVIDGKTFGLSDLLELAAKAHGRAPTQIIGDATDVLLSLGEI